MTAMLPRLTLAVGLAGTLAAVAGGWPFLVSWLGTALIVAGMLGIEEGKPT